jgi:outer membrane protein
MYLSGRFRIVGRGLPVLSLLALVSCESSLRDPDRKAPEPHARRVHALAEARLAADSASAATRPAEVPTRIVAPSTTQPVPSFESIYRHLPDPTDLPKALDEDLARRLAAIDANDRLTAIQKEEQRRETLRNHEDRLPGILARIKVIQRPREVRIAFADVIRRTLVNNFAIAAASYNPAIQSARIVEAEALFDEVFFVNFQYNQQNRPSASELESNNSDLRNVESGIRKLLPTGMTVQTSYALTRTFTDLVFQTFNPTYFNTFVVQFQQPLLRGFGLDYNRSQIEMTKIDREMSIERLRRDVREILFNVEQAYWQLLQARRVIGVASQHLSDLEVIQRDLEKRFQIGYDVYRVELSLTTSRIERSEAEFAGMVERVWDAEDALKRLMNDPGLNLSQNVGIIPVDAPTIEPIMFDELGEVTAGLSSREELHEAKLAIEKAQLGIGVAKNQALPKLDLLFRYVVDGLGTNADRAFSQLSENDFHEYVVGLQFEWPVGNRKAEAVLREARLQQAQAIAAERDVIENVIMEVKQAIRAIETDYDQIGPSARWVTAAAEWVEATKARQERRDPPTLQVELDGYDALQISRRALLDSLVNYNVALVNLERAKGTLLDYNNIVIRPAENENGMNPYRPTLNGTR